MFLILDNASPLFLKLMSSDNIIVSHQYKKINIFNRALRKIIVSFLSIDCSLFYENWKDSIADFSVIIIYAYRNNIDVIKYICKKKQPDQRVIVWYWNPVFRCVHPDLIKDLDCELWSFDFNDCQCFNLKFNTTYYFRNLELPQSSIEKIDVFFCGLNKGRKKILDSIQKKMVENNLLYHFHVVDEQLPVEEQKPRLSYQENLEYISSCKAVLDVLQEGQDGMTLRVMEALFFQKKLITNQLSLVKADFYHPNNIFIIGKDDWNNLKSFMNSPVFHISEEVKYKYDFFSWIERFGEKASL
ncbi:hypothetical protein [Bacteroides cellulosilyticus]|jgi:hypothetical protein|uniref:hypothetical protein n=1 Tax=Bacteroides cellulosilyticus TaxID=246787 RepID=UPI0018ACBA65|nr:hypothetical protein [Bacteroides cellulosilyticus]